MEFIIQNIGWFVGIGLILLLALVGYFADKRESINKIKDNEEKISNDNIISDSVDGQVPIQELNEENNINQINNENQQVVFGQEPVNYNENIDNNVNNELSSLMDNEFKNIEDAHMSLDDLEKKNYNDFLNNKNDLDSVDDSTSSNDLSFYEVINEKQDNMISNDINVNSNLDESTNSMESDDYIGVSDEAVNEFENISDLNSDNPDIAFDSEVLSQSVPELSDTVINGTLEQPSNNEFEDEESMLDLYNDSSDDDIWRF